MNGCFGWLPYYIGDRDVSSLRASKPVLKPGGIRGILPSSASYTMGTAPGAVTGRDVLFIPWARLMLLADPTTVLARLHLIILTDPRRVSRRRSEDLTDDTIEIRHWLLGEPATFFRISGPSEVDNC